MTKMLDAEKLGEIVRAEWLRLYPGRPARETRAAADVPWESCDPWTKHVDRCIGLAVQTAVLACQPVLPVRRADDKQAELDAGVFNLLTGLAEDHANHPKEVLSPWMSYERLRYLLAMLRGASHVHVVHETVERLVAQRRILRRRNHGWEFKVAHETRPGVTRRPLPELGSVDRVVEQAKVITGKENPTVRDLGAAGAQLVLTDRDTGHQTVIGLSPFERLSEDVKSQCDEEVLRPPPEPKRRFPAKAAELVKKELYVKGRETRVQSKEELSDKTGLTVLAVVDALDRLVRHGEPGAHVVRTKRGKAVKRGYRPVPNSAMPHQELVIKILHRLADTGPHRAVLVAEKVGVWLYRVQDVLGGFSHRKPALATYDRRTSRWSITDAGRRYYKAHGPRVAPAPGRK